MELKRDGTQNVRLLTSNSAKSIKSEYNGSSNDNARVSTKEIADHESSPRRFGSSTPPRSSRSTSSKPNTLFPSISTDSTLSQPSEALKPSSSTSDSSKRKITHQGSYLNIARPPTEEAKKINTIDEMKEEMSRVDEDDDELSYRKMEDVPARMDSEFDNVFGPVGSEFGESETSRFTTANSKMNGGGLDGDRPSTVHSYYENGEEEYESPPMSTRREGYSRGSEIRSLRTKEELLEALAEAEEEEADEEQESLRLQYVLSKHFEQQGEDNLMMMPASNNLGSSMNPNQNNQSSNSFGGDFLRSQSRGNVMTNGPSTNNTGKALDREKSQGGMGSMGIGVSEERVSKAYSEVDALSLDLKNIQDYYDATMQELNARLEEKEVKANDVRESFLEFKREIAKASVFSKTGKTIPHQQLEEFEDDETGRDQEVEKVRLKNITLRKQLTHLERGLRQREELKNGLHLIDFEQLKIENQTFTEKIEERNEELAKLRKKITNTVHILSHVKEKLQFVQAHNNSLREELGTLEGTVVSKRDEVGSLKHNRDITRAENMDLKQKSGLIGNDDLLRDYEKRMNELNTAKEKLKNIQKSHKELLEKTSRLKDAQTLAELNIPLLQNSYL